MKQLALALSLTVLFEEALMIVLNLKQKDLRYRMLVTFVMNCLTNPLLNLMILLFEIRSASAIIFLETAAVLAEAFVWRILTKDSVVRSLMMAFLLNVFLILQEVNYMHIVFDIAIDPFYTVNPLLEKAPMIAAVVVGAAALAAVVILKRRSVKK